MPGVSVESITPNPVSIDVNLSDKNTSETNTSATKPAQPTDGKTLRIKQVLRL